MVRYEWAAPHIRALRRHLKLSQAAFGRELGIRQATVSEWETGQYRPRGASARLLTLVAEQAGFTYEARRQGPGAGGQEGQTADEGEAEASHSAPRT